MLTDLTSTSVELAQARALLFRATARLLDRGFDATDLTLLSQFIDNDDSDGDADTNEAARHFALFGRDVLPYASSYVDVSGQLGGSVSDFCLSAYTDANFPADLSSASPDHFAVIFDFLGHLSEVEASADANAAGIARADGRAFVNHFLLAAMYPFVRAVNRHREQRYAAVLNGVWDVLLDYSGHSDSESAERWGVRDLLFEPGLDHDAASSETASAESEDYDLDLDNPKSRIRHIAEYFTNCARCGLYLSQTDIALLGSAHDIPRGFGSRADTLENLFHSAVALDGLSDLLAGLSAMVETERHRLSEQISGLSATALSAPHDLFSLEHQSNRLAATSAVIDRILSEAVQDSIDRD